MTPIPDASFYDDAESDGTNDELIVVDDEDDISDEEEDFEMPIDGMLIVNLMGLNIAPGMLGNDGAGVIENDNNSGAAVEEHVSPIRVPHFLAASVGRFQPFPYLLIPRGPGNDVIDTSAFINIMTTLSLSAVAPHAGGW